MSARASNFRRARLAFLLAFLGPCLALGVPACTHHIGDSCNSNVECSPLGDRFCDLSSPGGYCTVEGCDATSCPDDAVCVSFYSLQRATAACDVRRVPRSDCRGGNGCCEPGTPGCCRLGERCLCDVEGCTQGFCGSETSERRWCMHACDDQGGCREGYQCYPTNQGGAIAVSVRTDAGAIETPLLRYCAPTRSE